MLPPRIISHPLLSFYERQGLPLFGKEGSGEIFSIDATPLPLNYFQ